MIELLTVIAIVSILAGLLFSALSSVKVKADRIVCMNNLKNQLIALNLFVDDHSHFPRGISFSGRTMWIDALEEYSNDTWPINYPVSRNSINSIFSCPGYNKIKAKYYKKNNNFNNLRPAGAYAYNVEGASVFGSFSSSAGEIGVLENLGLGGDFLAYPPTDDNLKPISQNRIRIPSQMIALGDSLIITPYATLEDPFLAGFYDLSFWFSSPVGHMVLGEVPRGRPIFASTINSKNANKRRHDDLYNMGFLDCHVEGFRAEEIFDISKPEIRRMWNNDNESHPERSKRQ